VTPEDCKKGCYPPRVCHSKELELGRREAMKPKRPSFRCSQKKERKEERKKGRMKDLKV